MYVHVHDAQPDRMNLIRVNRVIIPTSITDICDIVRQQHRADSHIRPNEKKWLPSLNLCNACGLIIIADIIIIIVACTTFALVTNRRTNEHAHTL